MSVKNIKTFLIAIILLIISGKGFSQNIINVTGNNISIVEKNILFLRDTTNSLSIQDVIHSNAFKGNQERILNFYKTDDKTFWFHLKITNNTSSSSLLLNVDYPILNRITFYCIKNNAVIDSVANGFETAFNQRQLPFQNPLYKLHLSQKDTGDYYIKIKSEVPVFLPVKIGVYQEVLNDVSSNDVLTAIYLGIIISFFFYNIFIYFTVKDESYIYYIVYILFMGLTQLTLNGYTPRFLWPQLPEYTKYAIIIFPSIAGISSIFFAKVFLNTKQYYPRLQNFFNVFVFAYCLAIVLVLTGNFYYSYRVIDVSVSLLAIFALFISIGIAKKGSRPAIFFLISWTILIVFVVLFTFRNFGILPYNKFTGYLLYLGSALQAILLSIALADRINVYKKEKELSQAEALKVSLENETLIKEQNVMLEQKVTERTNELQSTNTQLEKTLSELKDAQTQLVEAEKMASLGQLTAGIAHEINNPINFVKSNIKPLNLDIDDVFGIVDMYNKLHNAKEGIITQQLQKINEKQEEIDLDFVKQEIKQLIKGIEDGAERTAEIVRGLRTFSRLDESELKVANVHDGFNSTLILMRNSMPAYVRIEKKFLAKGNIECFPGKLNQVFMNILNNAIQAIEEKTEKEAEEWILISTLDIPGDKIQINIKDSGIGMTEQVKRKIFEPFFTTKSVGVGTGLGMAIVFKIIEEHHGRIEVESEPGKGAEFILTLPYIHPVT